MGKRKSRKIKRASRNKVALSEMLSENKMNSQNEPEEPNHKEFGFVGRILTLAISLIALGISTVCFIRAPQNSRVIKVETGTNAEIHEIMREEYQLYQSDLSGILTVAGIIFTLFSIGVPLLQYQFITKEHVEALKEGLEKVRGADYQIQLAKKSVEEAQKAQTGQKQLKAEIQAAYDQQDKQSFEIRKQFVDQINSLREDQESLRKLTESIRVEFAEQLQGVESKLACAVQATGQAPAPGSSQPIQLLPKIGELYPKPFGKENWKWLVLDVDIANNRALLLSEDIIDKKPYDDVSYEEWKKASYRITWAECSLQKYLNGTFYESFGKDKERIEPTPNENPDNPEYGTKGGSRSTDKVFLLSIDEARRYFRNDNERKAKFNGSGFWWWLRSPGFTQYGAAFVDGDGNVCLGGNPVNFDAGGVRPALWLDL